ncbi:hypothetical protein LMG24238_02397 [Paraburkholderia sediminicola]|uniref:Uncharacterized protein n=1 Tax=Paraburkholderia sediminicola TaxID=458836 RepID=A0A6J5AR68_9BURK|nr:hypothetical protein LMG24238_02397 [Paraburkholderia sediminicola]
MPGKQNPDNNNALAVDEGDSGAHTDLIYFHIVSRRNSEDGGIRTDIAQLRHRDIPVLATVWRV